MNNNIKIYRDMFDTECNEVTRWEKAAEVTFWAEVADSQVNEAIALLLDRAMAWMKRHTDTRAYPEAIDHNADGKAIVSVTVRKNYL
jgi:hypothetical protein